MLWWILLVVLLLLIIAATPTWPHSRGWGYAPSGGLGLVLVILLILVLIGVIRVPGCRATVDRTPTGAAVEVDPD